MTSDETKGAAISSALLRADRMSVNGESSLPSLNFSFIGKFLSKAL